MDTALITKQIYAQAMMLGSCELFKGTEDLQQLIRLFTSPQGIEFCMEHHFPNLATLRLFKGMHMEDYGIYIDAGTITLLNPEKVVLIGRTSATINCDTLARHHIILLHSAKAIVSASKWAVVRIQAENGCGVVKSTSENAIIL